MLGMQVDITIQIYKDFPGSLTEYLEYRDCLLKQKEKEIGQPLVWEIVKDEDRHFDTYRAVIA